MRTVSHYAHDATKELAAPHLRRAKRVLKLADLLVGVLLFVRELLDLFAHRGHVLAQLVAPLAEFGALLIDTRGEFDATLVVSTGGFGHPLLVLVGEHGEFGLQRLRRGVDHRDLRRERLRVLTGGNEPTPRQKL